MPLPRRALLALPLAGCTPQLIPAGPRIADAILGDDALVMEDGARLPLRSWLPDGAPKAVLLCLHGFNDSRNFMTEPAPALNEAGVAVYAYDQRGFGGAPHRGVWPGSPTLAADAVTAARLVKARHPDAPLFLLGESMGGAVLLLASTRPEPPPAQGYVLLAPAVWGRVTMPRLASGLLDMLAHVVPRVAVASYVPGIVPTDNMRALQRMARDPLTIRETRVDTTKGLVDLMDDALAAGARLRPGMPPVLLVYGARDQLVPPVATRALLDRIPPGVPARIAFYNGVYHMPLRDLQAPTVIGDMLAWMERPAAPLPSGADRTGEAWVRMPLPLW
ncbi:lysophospholipase [Roseomonas sp. SSH11]|uniref:Lysophospholipase n=1 Tax=Pararoseomonas baculiformis TaxID=2820812 RepID=A0ABS4ACL9_9PROT|nr:alpha/beta hydrolase [Pararoseomonas baculiformis]MBP0444756.1 lysophospholipase [Pararoseomonas baculiformis]